MDYNYEALDEKRFQKLSQALIAAQYPNTQCLPVGQPDGGRDAFFFPDETNHDGFVVFQVKFSRAPNGKTERDSIHELIQSEKEKVKKLIARGATHYYFITNIQGTAHLDAGSIDKVNQELANAFGLPTQVWWRDDLDRRLDNARDIKWSYPEILKATDVLPWLIRNPNDSEDMQAAHALKSYMATQYETNKDIKFKQVELARKLTALFIDLPIGHKKLQNEQNKSRLNFNTVDLTEIEAYLSELDFYDDDDFVNETTPSEHSGLAGAFLLQMPFGTGVSRFVIEGAPGQGKSTVTQFLCQVNRLRLLQKKYELNSVADMHKIAPVRTPFQIDLRDFAAWVTGRHPFDKTGESTVPVEGSRSLESFLAMQVGYHSGGLKIEAHELLKFFSLAHSVIVLDGLDEVADITTREFIVKEICEAATRLDVHAKSMQIIVTSRPAAFANSPGFPEDDWFHLELKDLRRHNIEAYKNKWIEAQGLNEDEGNLISSTLHEKLEQPHLRDLSRNPMQLTILLQLIHVQGVALPEKRTTLYEEYMKIFFNREAEKSTVVRDHRELLLSIHGVLAWVLHTQAEDGTGSGSITKAELHNNVKTYLETVGHESDMAEELLKGTVERVGALVSRVEGMFEFEVQPLREYFAARHLYKTAPYSPAGKGCKGTKPDRFQALARSFYWTNVTRFFCGFYDVGELGSLVDGIVELSSQNEHNLINQPRRLAMMLLSDRVFSQAPRAIKRLINLIVDEPGFQRLRSTMTPRHRSDMSLPDKAGGDALFEASARKLEEDPSRRRVLREVMSENSSREKLKSIWTSRLNNGLMKCDPLNEAMDFGIEDFFSPQEIEKFAKNKNVNFHISWLMLANHYETVAENPSLHEFARKAFFDDSLKFPHRWRSQTDSVIALEVLTELLRPHALARFFSNTKVTLAVEAILSRGYSPRGQHLLEQVRNQYKNDGVDSLESFAFFVVDQLSKELSEWQQNLTPWSRLVDRGFSEAPGNYLMVRLAIIATLSKASAIEGEWGVDGFKATKGLVQRLFYARHKGSDLDWWRKELQGIMPETAIQYLVILLTWGTPDVIASLLRDIDSIISEFAQRDWSRLWSIIEFDSRTIQKYRVAISENWFQASIPISPRLALILIDRVDDLEAKRRLSRKHFANYNGNDVQIVRRAAEIELTGVEQYPVDWNHVQQLSILARQMGMPVLFPMMSSKPSKVPESVATVVLSNCEKHCDQLVEICEQAYSTIIAQRSPKVSQVAETEGWFVSSD